jgi:nucleoside-diphosphate-sugar epimerase
VTGANGFIGGATVRALLDAGYEVRAQYGPPANAPAQAAVSFSAVADIVDAEALLEIARGSSVAVHLAGPPSAARSFDEPIQFIRDHVTGTATVLEAARTAGITRFVYISSAEVYAPVSADPVSEKSAPAPRSPYGAAKAAAENLVSVYSRAYGMRCTILRPFSVFGPRSSPNSVVGLVVRQAVGERSIVVEDLRPVRDFVYVTDVADAIVLACGSQHDALEVFNIGTGVGTSIAGLASAVARIVDPALPISQRATGSSFDPARLVADASAAAAALGWRAKTALADGLKRTIEAVELER